MSNKKIVVDPFNRRMFLKGGGAMIAIPFLTSLLPREAQAQATDSTIRRFISVTGTYGSGHPMHQLPTTNRPGLAVAVPLDHKPVAYARLTDFVKAAGITRILGPGANSLANDITIMRGLDCPQWFASHGYAHVLGNLRGNVEGGNFPDTETIDHVLKRSAMFNPSKREVTYFKNLPFVGDTLFSYAKNAAGSIAGVSPIATDPKSLYNRLFNNGNYPESTGSPTTPAVPTHPRRDVLSRVLASYKSVRSGSQISRGDKIVLDNYIDLVQTIHNGLAAGSPGTSAGACLHKNILIRDDGQNFNSAETLRSFADIISAAIMCDLTRIVNFAYAIELGHSGFSGAFHEEITHPDHLAVHSGIPNHERIADARGFTVQKFSVRLAQNLAAATDPSNGKSYLYNSLVLTTTEDMIPHAPMSIPVILMGNAGGRMSSGNYIDYTDRTLGPIQSGFFGQFNSNPNDQRFSHLYYGQPYNRLMVTILQAMGLKPADYENAALNTGFQNVTDGRFGAQNNGIQSLGGYGVLASSSDNAVANRLKNYQLKYYKDPLPMP